MNREPIPPSIASIERPIKQLWTFYILKAIVSNVAIVIVLPLLYFRFHTMRYKFDEDGIHMRWGILVRREKFLVLTEKAPQVGLEPTTLRLTVTLEDSRREACFPRDTDMVGTFNSNNANFNFWGISARHPGFNLPDRQFECERRRETMKTGRDANRSGLYVCECCERERHFVKGEMLPRCPCCNALTIWELEEHATGDRKETLLSRIA